MQTFSELCNTDENVTTDENAKLRAENTKLQAENAKLKAENEQQKTEIKVLTQLLQEQAKEKSFSVECFKNNDNLFRF